MDGSHAGKGNVLVAEADESDGSFAKYHPQIAIITNSEADHLDHYGTQDNYRAIRGPCRTRHQGVIMCGDDEGQPCRATCA